MKQNRLAALIKVGVCIASFYFLDTKGYAQAETAVSDTIKGSDSISIAASPFGQRLATLSAGFITVSNQQLIDKGNGSSLVSAVNGISGVRMEERSPGSYRLNIRGSSLRSPFGVRNVKMYWNEIPLTDPGGNTYFNQLAINTVQQMSIYKGPAGSLYGAGSGGAVLMRSLLGDNNSGWQVGYNTGSYGMLNIDAALTFGDNGSQSRISYMHNEASGYREQSAMRRDQFAFTTEAFSGKKSRLLASALFTSLNYQTPGGLTPTQFADNPRSARPAAGPNPSAIEAKAAIAQTNFLAGLHHTYQLAVNWQTAVTLYAAFAKINNPSIRNYERRIEPHAGLRAMMVYKKNTQSINWQWHTGLEYQYGQSSIVVSDNVNGEPGATQTNDDLELQTGFVFTQLQAVINKKWQAVAGLSLNRNQFGIIRQMNVPVMKQQRSFDTEFAPRIELQYRWSDKIRTQASFSKGYSPPTSAEILPSTGILDLNLQAESGYNFEVANSWWLIANKLRWDINGFYFLLKDALVQQRDASGADFFINAGSTKQIGLEQQLSFVHRNASQLLFKEILLQAAHTYSAFQYTDYNKTGIDFGGNKLPGIPEHAVSFTADLLTHAGIFLRVNYFYNSRVWLNDANSFSAEPFHLLGFRVGYKGKLLKHINWQLYGGVENLLNENYGLGHDINAFGNRFYNAMPDRNYYFGIAISR